MKLSLAFLFKYTSSIECCTLFSFEKNQISIVFPKYLFAETGFQKKQKKRSFDFLIGYETCSFNDAKSSILTIDSSLLYAKKIGEMPGIAKLVIELKDQKVYPYKGIPQSLLCYHF